MVNQCTKFEVFPRDDAMNGGAKFRKWGGLGQLGVTQGQPQFDTAHTISCLTLIETMRLSCTFSRYSQIFVESRRF